MPPPPKPINRFAAQKTVKAIKPGIEIPRIVAPSPIVKNPGHNLPIKIKRACEPV